MTEKQEAFNPAPQDSRAHGPWTRLLDMTADGRVLRLPTDAELRAGFPSRRMGVSHPARMAAMFQALRGRNVFLATRAGGYVIIPTEADAINVGWWFSE